MSRNQNIRKLELIFRLEQTHQVIISLNHRTTMAYATAHFNFMPGFAVELFNGCLAPSGPVHDRDMVELFR